MSNESNKPIEAEELTEKELEGIVGGAPKLKIEAELKEIATAECLLAVPSTVKVIVQKQGKLGHRV